MFHASRWALIVFVVAGVVYAIIDVSVGRRYTEDSLLVENGLGVALQVLAVCLVLQGRRWTWNVAALLNVLSAGLAVATVFDHTLAFASTPPLSFLAAEATLALIGTIAWFIPGVRPTPRTT